jgi:enoyl-CoA hydratase/carnithine racemase
MRGARQMELADVLELSALFQGMSHTSADHLEAVAAFLEKRAPTFSGR